MVMRFWRAAMAVGGIVVAMTGPLQASEPKIQITGIYSDLYYNREGGDLLGTELFIVGAGSHGHMAFVQSWQGGTGVPVVVPIQVDGNKVTFSVPEQSLGEGKYEGRISRTGFDGTWHHPLASGGFAEDPIHLKRKKSYWQ